MYIPKLFSVFLMSFFFIFATFSQTTPSPVDYMAAISGDQQTIGKRMLAYSSATVHSSPKQADKKRNKLIAAVEEAKEKVAQTPGFQGDDTYKKAVLAYYAKLYDLLATNYAQLVGMEEKAQESYEVMEAFLRSQEAIEKQQSEATKTVRQAHAHFAEKHNITLMEEESELGNLLDTANAVNKYENDMFLIVFRMQIAENKLLNTLQKPIEEMEAAYADLAEQYYISLQALQEMKNFEDDETMTDACSRMLTFYGEEADELLAASKNAAAQNKKLDVMQQALSEKQKKNIKKKEVDAYNAQVDKANKAANKLNRVNDKYNYKRETIVLFWEGTTRRFLQKYMPKYELYAPSFT